MVSELKEEQAELDKQADLDNSLGSIGELEGGPHDIMEPIVTKKDLPKVMLLSHGGCIMELFNVFKGRKNKEPPTVHNDIKNCGINRIRIYKKEKKNAQGKVTTEIAYEIVKKNDVEHLNQ